MIRTTKEGVCKRECRVGQSVTTQILIGQSVATQILIGQRENRLEQPKKEDW